MHKHTNTCAVNLLGFIDVCNPVGTLLQANQANVESTASRKYWVVESD